MRCNQLIDTASSPVCITQISSQILIANGIMHSFIRSVRPTSTIMQPPHMSTWDEQPISFRLSKSRF